MFLKWCVFLFAITYCTEIVKGRRACISPEAPNSDAYDSIAEFNCQKYVWEMKKRQVKKSCNTFGIAHGEKAKIWDYPHMGAVGWRATDDSWAFLCGSSLISDKFALTAAHCTSIKKTNIRDKNPKIIRFGSTNIVMSSNEMPTDIAIDEIIRHPNYTSPRKYYDIALLKLKDTVKFTENIQPACLWNKPTFDTQGKEFTVTGWGRTEEKKTSNVLMVAKLDIFDSEVCDKRIMQNKKWTGMSDHQLCAGKMNGQQDTCQGDSGGPLQYKFEESVSEGTIHMVVGITSFGSSRCGRIDSTGIYTKVSSFIDWIEEHVWQQRRIENFYL